MKIFKYNFVWSIVILPIFIFGSNTNLSIDTSRFTLKNQGNNFQLKDCLLQKFILLEKSFFINSKEEIEEGSYVSSFNFEEKTNSFEIGNGLICIQISSYSFMREGSAQAAIGRDLFLTYDPKNITVLKNKLDFGITKQRQRYMGCLSAKTFHFILSDANYDGLIDIGYIKEELRCKEFSNPDKDLDIISGPYFQQDSIKWYSYKSGFWNNIKTDSTPGSYIELPLINIKLSPIDFFGNIIWHSYDPKNWNSITGINYYPKYRLELIKTTKNKN